jgi:uncharacterized OB-fold protein
MLIGRRNLCESCGSDALSERVFEGAGTLLSFTEVFPPPNGHGAPASYFIALIQLNGGPRLLAQVTDAARATIRTGLQVESVIRRLGTADGDGPILYGYKFRPLLGSPIT